MLFNSFEFLFLFLPGVLAAYYLARRYLSHLAALFVLNLASLVFYAWWDVRNLPLLLFSVAVSVLSLAKANSDMFDRELIARVSAEDRPSGWRPRAGEGVAVAADAELTAGFTLLAGDSAVVVGDDDENVANVRVKLDWWTRLMRMSPQAEGVVPLKSLRPPPSTTKYVMWTLGSMTHHAADIGLRMACVTTALAFAVTGWTGIGVAAALIVGRATLWWYGRYRLGVSPDELPRPVAVLASFFSDNQWSANARMHALAGTLTAVEGMALLSAFRSIGSADSGVREVVMYGIAMLAMLKFATENFVHEPLHAQRKQEEERSTAPRFLSALRSGVASRLKPEGAKEKKYGAADASAAPPTKGPPTAKVAPCN